jgi:xanthine dehydrogenase YagR molybdenum-binding subunit
MHRDCICAKLAQQAKAPVKLMLDRKEEHLDTGNRPSATARIRAGVTADGVLTAFDGQSWGTGGAGQPAGFPLPYIYNFPNRRRTHKDVYINAGPQRAMRAPGHPQGCFLTEILMDELADRVKMDPVAFRVKNLPPRGPNAMWADTSRGREALAGTSVIRPAINSRPIKTGMGVSAHRWGGGAGSHARMDIPRRQRGVKCGTRTSARQRERSFAIVAAGKRSGMPVTG